MLARINGIPLVHNKEQMISQTAVAPFLFYTFSLLLLIAGCTTMSPTTPIPPNADFKLIILKETWFDLHMGYDPEPAEAALQAADLSTPLWVAGKEHIETYDWDAQTLTLTRQGTEELIEAVATLKGTDPEGVAQLKALQESLGWGNPLERALYIHPFVVQVDSQFKYGGIFLDAPSQMAINFPVIRVTLVDGKAHLALLPTHIPFVMVDPVTNNGAMQTPVIVEEAQSDVQQLDFFTNWSAQLATSDVSQKFRAIIRDEAIHQIFSHP